jgi:hypothetical protein
MTFLDNDANKIIFSFFYFFKTIMECQELEPNCGEQVLINVLIYAFCWSFGGAIQVF